MATKKSTPQKPTTKKSASSKKNPPPSPASAQKYEITDETFSIKIDGKKHQLHRIRAVRDITVMASNEKLQCTIKSGSLGGWIEKEENLSQSGDCWIEDGVIVFDNGQVCDDAFVTGYYNSTDHEDLAKACNHHWTWIFNHAHVGGTAYLSGTCKVFGRAVVDGWARVTSSIISDDAWVGEHANVFHSHVSNQAKVYGNASLHTSKIYDLVDIFDEADLRGRVEVRDESRIFGYARIWADNYGSDIVQIVGKTEISGHHTIMSSKTGGTKTIKDQVLIGDDETYRTWLYEFHPLWLAGQH